MAQNYGPAQDGLLAMISVLSVMFLVLFVSCAYFLSLRGEIAQRDAETMASLYELQRTAPVRGNVAGYATEQPVVTEDVLLDLELPVTEEEVIYKLEDPDREF